jgi:tyrosyl-DNA phosphodiesterase-1
MMTDIEAGSRPAAKRRKLDDNDKDNDNVAAATTLQTPGLESQNVAKAIERPISPPLSRTRRRRSGTPPPSIARIEANNAGRYVVDQTTAHEAHGVPPVAEGPMSISKRHQDESRDEARFLPSPIQLTRIKDLGVEKNVDALGLEEILGDPLIRECWCFNFLFDVEFIMKHFDPKLLVKVNIVHGFWRNDDQRKIGLMESASHYPNINLIPAYIPDPFGTHHTKMLILFRDEHAQIVIHSANMIPRDWGNMTQGVWRSPLLPLSTSPNSQPNVAYSIGTGERFKVDILKYLNAYGRRLHGLTSQLVNYEFSSIKAAFLGSAPSRQKPAEAKSAIQTSFGWLGLKEILSAIPIKAPKKTTNRKQVDNSKPNIVIQVSSIATLGQNPTWLEHFQSVLSSHLTSCTAPTQPSKPTNAAFFTKASSLSCDAPATKFNIIFPTPSEIRTSLDGYVSGNSIHTKIQSPAQQKQLEYLHPLFCHWKSSSPASQRREALRGPAAPHIKTYIGFSDETQKTIDWALLTSANMSKQAWGDVVSNKGEIWIQSWEAGVLVWPEIFGEGNREVNMVPVFGSDTPGLEDDGLEEVARIDYGGSETETETETENDEVEDAGVVDPDETEDDEEDEQEQNPRIDPEETEDEDEEQQAGNSEHLDKAGRLKNKEKDTTPDLRPKIPKAERNRTIIGFRMPYDLPITPYGTNEVPWCASLADEEPDWMGRRWKGF